MTLASPAVPSLRDAAHAQSPQAAVAAVDSLHVAAAAVLVPATRPEPGSQSRPAGPETAGAETHPQTLPEEAASLRISGTLTL